MHACKFQELDLVYFIPSVWVETTAIYILVAPAKQLIPITSDRARTIRKSSNLSMQCFLAMYAVLSASFSSCGLQKSVKMPQHFKHVHVQEISAYAHMHVPLKKETNFLQVIYLVVHWIHLWAFLLSEDQREAMDTRCNRLLTVAHDCFFQAIGWRHISRIKNG
jgi:hypothetical protein